MGRKIVRDNDEAVCRAMGISGQWRPSATPIAGLTAKIFEEGGEAVGDMIEGVRDPGEWYDLRDVISELILRLDPAGLAAKAHEAKVARRGGFSRCIEWTPVPAGEGE